MYSVQYTCKNNLAVGRSSAQSSHWEITYEFTLSLSWPLSLMPWNWRKQWSQFIQSSSLTWLLQQFSTNNPHVDLERCAHSKTCKGITTVTVQRTFTVLCLCEGLYTYTYFSKNIRSLARLVTLWKVVRMNLSCYSSPTEIKTRIIQLFYAFWKKKKIIVKVRN